MKKTTKIASLTAVMLALSLVVPSAALAASTRTTTTTTIENGVETTTTVTTITDDDGKTTTTTEVTTSNAPTTSTEDAEKVRYCKAPKPVKQKKQKASLKIYKARTDVTSTTKISPGYSLVPHYVVTGDVKIVSKQIALYKPGKKPVFKKSVEANSEGKYKITTRIKYKTKVKKGGKMVWGKTKTKSLTQSVTAARNVKVAPKRRYKMKTLKGQKQFIQFINLERQTYGLPPLTYSADLSKAAKIMQKSDYHLAEKDAKKLTNPNFSKKWAFDVIDEYEDNDCAKPVTKELGIVAHSWGSGKLKRAADHESWNVYLTFSSIADGTSRWKSVDAAELVRTKKDAVGFAFNKKGHMYILYGVRK